MRLIFCAMLLVWMTVPPSVQGSSKWSALTSGSEDIEGKDFDPCCAFPCEHEGVCISYPNRTFTCDCTSTGFYGPKCEIREATFGEPDPSTIYNLVTSNDWLWPIVNSIPYLRRILMKEVYRLAQNTVDSPALYDGEHCYINVDAHFNHRYHARALPPVPKHCPTPMGIKGPKVLPDIEELIEKVFERKTFKPEPHGTNALFTYYAQHFTHQFFRTNITHPQYTLGMHGVDASNIYGLTESDRQALRSKVNGKLRTQLIQGEEFPPYLKDVPGIEMYYEEDTPEEMKFALPHPFFGILPGLFAYSTIWLREHNRVCDVLQALHPHWDDERLYQTARLIIIGEVIKITIEDYVQHLSQYKFKLLFEPELTFGTDFQYNNRIHAEFVDLYHWHPLVPDYMTVSGKNYSLEEMLFSLDPILNHSLDEFIHSLVNTQAGALTNRNHPKAAYHPLRAVLENGRKLRFQTMNAYRRKFGAKPYASFMELTEDKELATILEEFYGDVEAVEYYVGLLSERPGKSVTPETMVYIGGPWSLKGLMANPISTPKYWKPYTFGGPEGMDIIKTASIQKLFCQNMKHKCHNIGFKLPQGSPQIHHPSPKSSSKRHSSSSSQVEPVSQTDSISTKLVPSFSSKSSSSNTKLEPSFSSATESISSHTYSRSSSKLTESTSYSHSKSISSTVTMATDLSQGKMSKLLGEL